MRGTFGSDLTSTRHISVELGRSERRKKTLPFYGPPGLLEAVNHLFHLLVHHDFIVAATTYWLIWLILLGCHWQMSSPKILRKDAHTMQDAPILSHTQCAAASNPVSSWLRAWSASLFGVVPRPRVWTHQPSGCKGTTTKAWSQPRPWQGHENLNKWTTRGVSVSEIYGHFWPDHLKKNNGKLENHQVCKWLLHWDDLTVTPRQELWKIFDYSCFFSFKFCLRIIVSLLWRLWCFFSGVFVAVGRLNLLKLIAYMAYIENPQLVPDRCGKQMG